MFLSSAKRKRARPSILSLGLSVLVFAAASYLVVYLFQGSSYAPLSVALLMAAGVYLYRSRRLRRRLPPPYGDSLPETIGARDMARTGLLMVAGGLAFVVLPLASVFFLPILFFILYLSLPLGISLAEVLHFAWIARLEARAGAEIYSVTEEGELDGKPAITKTTVLIPRDAPGRA